MSVKNFIVSLVERKIVKDFVETWHYSKNINGVIGDYCFALYDGESLIGAMIYGRLAMRNQYKKYVVTESEIIELRRLCCIDDTPKNTESYFIGTTLRWLKRNTSITTVLSYADTTYGHVGTIYKASNFVCVGQSPASKVIRRLSDGKLYHDKTIRTKYKGKLKPFAEILKNQLVTGEAIYEKTLPKNIYLYKLK